RLGRILFYIFRRTMHRHAAPPPGTRIGYENNEIVVPDDPIIPFIEGDGTGPDIWRATQHVIDGTLAKVYGSKKKIHWFEGLAGSDGANTLIECINTIERRAGAKIRPGSAIGIKPMSELGSKRLVRKAIQYAIAAKRDSVTLIHKGNIQKFTEGAFKDWGYQ